MFEFSAFMTALLFAVWAVARLVAYLSSEAFWVDMMMCNPDSANVNRKRWRRANLVCVAVWWIALALIVVNVAWYVALGVLSIIDTWPR